MLTETEFARVKAVGCFGEGAGAKFPQQKLFPSDVRVDRRALKVPFSAVDEASSPPVADLPEFALEPAPEIAVGIMKPGEWRTMAWWWGIRLRFL